MSVPLNNYQFTCYITPDGKPTVPVSLMTVTGLEDDGSGEAHICLCRAVIDGASDLYSWFTGRDARDMTIDVAGGVAVEVKQATPERYTLSNLDAGANQKWLETLHITGIIHVIF